MQTPSSTVLYVDYFSPPSLSVVALVLFNKIPLQVRDIGTIKKDPNLLQDYKKVNPQGALPFLDDNGFTLSESHAILRYLCTTKNVAKNWYPEDPKKRAQIDAYLEWHNTNIRKCTLYFQTYYAHVMPKAYFTWDAAEEKRNVIKALNTLENYNLKNGKFIASNDEMTIADLSAISEIVRIKATKIDFEVIPRVKAWMEECMKCPEIQKANKAPLVLVEKATSRLHL